MTRPEADLAKAQESRDLTNVRTRGSGKSSNSERSGDIPSRACRNDFSKPRKFATAIAKAITVETIQDAIVDQHGEFFVLSERDGRLHPTASAGLLRLQ
jgi:hypothetical protein